MHEWTMSDERNHLVNLLGQRLNFLLIFYSIVFAGAFGVKDQFPFIQILLFIGTLITFLLSLTIRRAQQKLNIVFEFIYKDDNHPAKLIKDRMKGSSKRNIIGYVIPSICWITLFVAFVASVVFAAFKINI
jgi:hypothetical protein